MNVLKAEAFSRLDTKFEVKSSELVYEKLIDDIVRPWFLAKRPGFTSNVYEKAMGELHFLKEKFQAKKKKNGGKEKTSEEEKREVQKTDLERTLEEKIYSISIKDEKIQELKRKISILNEQIKEANAEIENLRMRNTKETDFQRIQTASVTESDEYTDPRPTRLAEQYSDLLDREWCDAFENLTGRDDVSKAKILHSIIREAFEFCRKRLQEQTENIASELLQLHKDTFVGEKEIKKELQDLTRILTSTRHRMAPTVAQRIAEAYIKDKLKSLLNPSEMDAGVKQYVYRCVELCWNFAVSDPQLVISEDDSGRDFRSEVYKAYTRSDKGLKKPKVDFIVWPALYLHEKGPLVSKGVAQPL